jgi:hypothetical protein
MIFDSGQQYSGRASIDCIQGARSHAIPVGRPHRATLTSVEGSRSFRELFMGGQRSDIIKVRRTLHCIVLGFMRRWRGGDSFSPSTPVCKPPLPGWYELNWILRAR